MPKFTALVMVFAVLSLASSRCCIIAVEWTTPGSSPMQGLLGESDHVILRGPNSVRFFRREVAHLHDDLSYGLLSSNAFFTTSVAFS